MMESKFPQRKHPRISLIAVLISNAHVIPLCYFSCVLQTTVLLLFAFCLTLTRLTLFVVISPTSFLRIPLLGCNETCTHTFDVTPQPLSAGPSEDVSPFLSLSNHNSKGTRHSVGGRDWERQAETDSGVPGAY